MVNKESREVYARVKEADIARKAAIREQNAAAGQSVKGRNTIGGGKRSSRNGSIASLNHSGRRMSISVKSAKSNNTVSSMTSILSRSGIPALDKIRESKSNTIEGRDVVHS